MDTIVLAATSSGESSDAGAAFVVIAVLVGIILLIGGIFQAIFGGFKKKIKTLLSPDQAFAIARRTFLEKGWKEIYLDGYSATYSRQPQVSCLLLAILLVFGFVIVGLLYVWATQSRQETASIAIEVDKRQQTVIHIRGKPAATVKKTADRLAEVLKWSGESRAISDRRSRT
jgi:hypothetical protein